MKFEESEKPDIRIVAMGEEGKDKIKYEKLQIIEFSSDRKRETIIIRSLSLWALCSLRLKLLIFCFKKIQ